MNNRTAPEMYGFPGGIYHKDGSTQYIGYGNGNGCRLMTTCPGFILTTEGKAGCYMPCQDTKTEMFDTTKAFYLAYHPKLRWVNTTISDVNNHAGAIRFNPNGWHLKIGRTCSKNLVQVGRVHYTAIYLRLFSYGIYTELGGSSFMELLVCDP